MRTYIITQETTRSLDSKRCYYDCADSLENLFVFTQCENVEVDQLEGIQNVRLGLFVFVRTSFSVGLPPVAYFRVTVSSVLVFESGKRWLDMTVVASARQNSLIQSVVHVSSVHKLYKS